MILAIMNRAGGVGKSVTAHNLAVAWATPRKPVLVIDADAQATVTKYYPPALRTLAHVLTGVATLEESIVEVRPGVFLLAASDDLDDLTRQWLMLPDICARAAERFSIIVIDTPAGWHMPTRQAVQAATHVVIPINSEIKALESALATQEYVNENAPRPTFFLLTKWRESAGARTVADWPAPWLKTKIPRLETINTLTMRSQSVFDMKSGAARQAYADLAQELKTKCRKTIPAAANPIKA